MGPMDDYSDAGRSSGGGDSLGGIAALLALGGGLYDSYQNRKTSKRNVDKTIAAQKAEAELAYQRDLQMWHMQNAYNSPEAQMARFRAGGLNPNLIYGQGNAGNSSGTVSYHPANLQYKYEAGNYGQAVQSVIPTLMAVGTWMQNMRLSETEIRSKQLGQEKVTADTERVRQLVDHLRNVNPQLFQQAVNKTFMQDYQTDALRLNNARIAQSIEDMQQEYRYKYGEELFQALPTYGDYGYRGRSFSQGGFRKLQFLEQESKTRLAEAKASWTDMDITDPQALVMMVLQGVMGMAGAQLRVGRSQPKAPVKRERPRGLNRRRMGINHPDR